jgi:endonuclease/exonuclease/phosphatase family metal-dependent hydrolase
MRVLTWNVQHGRPNPGGPPAIGPVVDALRALAPDVVAVQELDRNAERSGRIDQPTQLAEALGGTLVWGPTVRQGAGEYGIGLIVRGEVVACEVIALAGTREPRALLLVEVDVAGRRWTVGGTHLSRNRHVARRQLVRVFDALAAHPAPRVLLGDLNLVPAEVLPWSTAAGYHLVDGPPTHSTRQARLTRRIDHVLVAGATATEAAVHHLPVSDHCAVTATLTAVTRSAPLAPDA